MTQHAAEHGASAELRCARRWRRNPFGDLLARVSEHRAMLSAPTALGIGIAVLLLAACARSHAAGKWTLEAYDKDKGYTFRHDGVVYHTRCMATGRPVLADAKPDLDPGALPPDPAHDESACAELLTYLHKPVPSLTQPYPSILLFVGESNWRLEFVIENAK